MSKTDIEGWAVDLAEVGAIYPFQGYEFLMVMIGVIAWLWWHVWCMRWESQYHRDKIAKYGASEHMNSAIDSE